MATAPSRAMWKIAALGAAAIAGCYSPSFTSCITPCASDEDCAPGLSCTTANMCARPTEAAACEAVAPADAAVDALAFGTFHVQLTNAANGCSFPNWQVGATSAIDVVFSHNGDVIVAEPEGATATFLDAWLGTHVFAGTLTGDALELVLAGNKTATKGNCSYTFDATFKADIAGGALAGELAYRARTNMAPACGSLTGCATRQSFTATR